MFLSAILENRSRSKESGLKYSQRDHENVEWDDELIPTQKGAINWYPHFDEEELIRIWKQIIQAIIHLQHEGYWHRDIRPQNIVITEYQEHVKEVGNFEITDKILSLLKNYWRNLFF